MNSILKDTKKKIDFIETSTRICSPTETLNKVSHLIGEGNIVPKVMRVDSIDRFGVPIHMSYSKKSKDNDIDYNSPHAGKGATAEESKCSAIFEAIERYSAKMQGNEKVITSGYNGLSNAIAPDKLILNDGSTVNNYTLLEWSEAYSLTYETTVYVPANFVYFPYRPIDNNVTEIIPHDTNGLAAGNSMSEAILHALYEVVEKDAFCIFWRNIRSFPNLELEGVTNKNVLDILKKLEDNNIKVYIKDITTDIKIPSIAAILDCRAINEPAFVYGSGSHLDPEIALLRAITEALQLRASQLVLLNYKPELKNKIVNDLGFDSHDIIENLISRDCAKFIEPQLLECNHTSNKISDYKKYKLDDMSECLDTAVQLVKNEGYEVLYVNITRSEVGIPSVRVLIPGLQPSTGLNSRKSSRLISIPKLFI